MSIRIRDFIVRTADVPGFVPGDVIAGHATDPAAIVAGKRYIVCKAGKPVAFGRVTYAGPHTLVIRQSVRRFVVAKSPDLEVWKAVSRWRKVRQPSVPVVRHVPAATSAA